MSLEWSKWLKTMNSPKTGLVCFRDGLVKLIFDNEGWLELPIEVDAAIQAVQASTVLNEDIYKNDFVTLQLEDVQDEKVGEIRMVKIIPSGREEHPEWHVRVKRSEFIRMKNGNL